MKKYSYLGVFKSRGRLIRESKNIYRSDFQRDRDRIIHSDSFRRLKHKTQVFVNTDGDHYRTRITHSIEVAQIARSMSRYLNLNDDLAETLSLAHDLGHTPFGHVGEEILDDCMTNHGGFDHNLQTLRIVMFIEHKYLKFKGLNLTIETLDGLLKHNGPIINKIKIDKLLGIKNFKNKINFKKYPSLEAQISSISDDIAYNNHDIQDGIRANLFSFNDLVEINFFKEIYKSQIRNIKGKDQNILIYQIVRDSIDLMVKDLINNTVKNINNYKIKNLRNIYSWPENIVNFSNKFKYIENEIKSFLKYKMYDNKKVLKKNNDGKRIIVRLFNKISKNPGKFISKDKLKDDKFRVISDYISGMTDRYAINLYNKLK